MKPLLLATLTALIGQAATADIACTTASGEHSYLIDETAQTITFNDLPPQGYYMQVRPLQALAGRVTAVVKIPTTGADTHGTFHLWFGRFGEVSLRDDFTMFLNSTEMAFASVEAIMRSVTGVPCQQLP